MYYILLFFVLICFFVYMQVRFHRIVHNDYQILQLSDPNKDLLEKTLNEKYPTVITNVVKNWHGINELVGNTDIIKSPKFKKVMNGFINFYNIPLAIMSDNTLNLYDAGDTSYITKQNSARYFLIQIKGNSKVILFAPKEEEYLYPTQKRTVSRVNFWKIEALTSQNKEDEKAKYLDKFTEFNKAKYIEILLSEGHMLFIPYGWWFTVLSVEDSVRIVSTSSSLFSW